jgi:hypothetical protein
MTAEAFRALGLTRSSYHRNHVFSTAKRQVRRQIPVRSRTDADLISRFLEMVDDRI